MNQTLIINHESPASTPPRPRQRGRGQRRPGAAVRVRIEEESVDDPQRVEANDDLPPATGRTGRGRGRPPIGRRGRGRPAVGGRNRGRQAAAVQVVPEVQAVPVVEAAPAGRGRGRRGRRRLPETFVRAETPARGLIRARDLSPGQLQSYKRARGPLCQPGQPIIKFENLLPPTPPPRPENPQAPPPPPPPPRDINEPLTLQNHTWHNVKCPGEPDIKPGLTRQPGPSEHVSGIQTTHELFDTFLPPAMLEKVVTYTNRMAEEQRQLIGEANRGAVAYENTTTMELRAFIGCLIMSGDRKDNHLTTELLFTRTYGTTFYSCLFTQKRFEFLIRCLRFDDKDARETSDDKFHKLREFWDAVIPNCSRNYIPGPILTVDEQLQGFRGRCGFRVYIANKPNKYGIKVFMVCDAKTGYCLNAIPYLAKDGHPEIPAGQLQGTYFTLKLLEPLHEYMKDTVVCCDNWFTGMGLVSGLQRIGAGLVGTTRPKKYLPDDTVKLMNLPIGESVALYDHDYKVNIVYTKVKAKKFVALLTTEHNTFS